MGKGMVSVQHDAGPHEGKVSCWESNRSTAIGRMHERNLEPAFQNNVQGFVEATELLFGRVWVGSVGIGQMGHESFQS